MRGVDDRPRHTRRAFLGATGAGAALALLGAPAWPAVIPGPDPTAVTVYRDRRRLALAGNADVELIDFGRGLRLIDAAGAVELPRASGGDTPSCYVAATRHGQCLALLDRGCRRIELYTPTGGHVSSIPLEGVAVAPASVHSYHGELWVTDSGAHQVLRISRSGQARRAWGGEPWCEQSLNGPTAMAVDRDGMHHVLEIGHGRISVWTPGGRLLGSYGQSRITAGARGLVSAVGDAGLLTLDAWRQTAQLHDGSGRLLAEERLGPAASEPLLTLTGAPDKGIYFSL